ncbi:hypothetical protein ISP15_14435 [Dyella jejuensis]|uniref:Uncharacterized protein n=1 Tax=Dyella jejuensis TaxID=1432009 RepID=A0ABW8JNV0_9GAMM
MHMLPSGSNRLSSPRRPLRRLSAELIAIVLAKVAFFALLGWYLTAHYPRPDTHPAAIEHLLAPSASITPETKP